MIDREKVIKGLEWHIRTTKARECRYAIVDCPYVEECKTSGSEKLLEDALTLLKEQEAVVRCVDCQFHYAGENEVDAWDRCRLHSINTEPNNYCSWAIANR